MPRAREKNTTPKYVSKAHLESRVQAVLIEKAASLLVTLLVTIGGVFIATYLTVRTLVEKVSLLDSQINAKVSKEVYISDQNAVIQRLDDIYLTQQQMNQDLKDILKSK